MAREVLKKWNKNTFGIIHERKNDLEGKLAKLQKDMSSLEIAQLERQIRMELLELEEMEQVLWFQKSRIDWFVEGDQNTKIYPVVVNKRRL